MIMVKGMSKLESWLGFPHSNKYMGDAYGQVKSVGLLFTQESGVEDLREMFHSCNSV